MENIYIPFYDRTSEGILVPLESFLVAFIAQWSRRNELDESQLQGPDTLLASGVAFVLVRIQEDGAINEVQLPLPKTALKGATVHEINYDKAPKMIQQCSLPAILCACDQLCISGLCNVLRFLLKMSPFGKAKNLLGFRQGCLISCAEVSVWTKFCEIDILETTKRFLKESRDVTQAVDIPTHVSRFEVHLKQPLRTHNIGKEKHIIMKRIRIQNFNKRMDERNSKANALKASSEIPKQRDVDEALSTLHQQSSPAEMRQADPTIKPKAAAGHQLPELSHDYSEGMAMTLADLIIFICIHHIFCRFSWKQLCSNLPAITDWYKRLFRNSQVNAASKVCGLKELPDRNLESDRLWDVLVPWVQQESLYIRDPKRDGTGLRQYTKQADVIGIIEKLKILNIQPLSDFTPSFLTKALDWSEMPDFILPTFGNLPESRFTRKCQQLENMALAICDIAVDGDIIVDFCSGGGHLGMLLARLLPNCHVIMIENKEESVGRALIRAQKLLNTSIFQCNLDYFKGKFNIGVALHACGTATDLVLQRCLQNNAAFVVCPCCYGSMREANLISYPRSNQFQAANITTLEYFILGHAADQTHENGHKNSQGKYCMGLVDADRCLQAAELDYKIKTFTMQPPTCTPKNNIILGVPSKRCKELDIDWL